MSRPFAITTAAETVEPNAKGVGEVSFTVSNSTTHPLRGQAKAKALDSTKQEWLSIDGEADRDYAPNATQQVTVRVAIPPGTPPGKYNFRLDVDSAANPDEDYTEGPVIGINVKPAPKPAKKFPLWIIPVILGVLVIGSLIIWLLLPKNKVDVPDVTKHSLADAEKILAQKQLKGELKDTKVTHTASIGQVADQDPKPHDKAAPDTVVELTIEGDLSGSWQCNDLGTYVIKQSGDDVSWEGKSADGGKTFTNAFEGKIQGNEIVGKFKDQPPGITKNQGPLAVKIVSERRLERLTSSTSFGGSVWTR